MAPSSLPPDQAMITNIIPLLEEIIASVKTKFLFLLWPPPLPLDQDMIKAMKKELKLNPTVPYGPFYP